MRLNRLEDRVDRTVAIGFGRDLAAPFRHHHFRVRPFTRLGLLIEAHKAVVVIHRVGAGRREERLDVLIKNLALLIREVLEAEERFVDFHFARHRNAELLDTLLEGVAAGELPEHDAVLRPAHIFSPHDFVRLAGLDDAILMDAGCVGESVRADNRLIRLHRETGDRGDELRSRHKFLRVDPGFELKVIGTRLHRHHDFLKRAVAGAFAKAVNRALELPRAADQDA